MATYFDEHADLAPVQRRRVAVLGDGEEAVVHATVLRDSGVDVHIGTAAASMAAVLGEGEGLLCIDPATAVAEADLVVLTRGDGVSGALLDEARPGLSEGMAVVVLDPVALHFGELRLPVDVDVVLVSPLAAAATLEAEFSAGRGVPAVVAVAQDLSGTALELALSYAKAIGCTRAGVVGSSVSTAAETALFGQYAVVGGAVEGLLRQAFDVLAAAGYPRDLAYIACVHGLREAVDRTYDPASARSEETAAERAAIGAGGRLFARAGLRETLEAALADVRAGRVPNRDDAAPADEANGPGDALAAAARRVRRLMPWVGASERDARHAR